MIVRNAQCVAVKKLRSGWYMVNYQMLESVAESFNMTLSDLQSRKRDAKVVEARQVVIYLLWKSDGHTLNQIGELLGGRCPADISHNFQKIAVRLLDDELLRDRVRDFENNLNIWQ